jgi:hypothetical protein
MAELGVLSAGTAELSMAEHMAELGVLSAGTAEELRVSFEEELAMMFPAYSERQLKVLIVNAVMTQRTLPGSAVTTLWTLPGGAEMIQMRLDWLDGLPENAEMIQRRLDWLDGLPENAGMTLMKPASHLGASRIQKLAVLA